MKLLKTNTAVRVTVGCFVDYSDGVTPETSITVTNTTCQMFVDADNGSGVTLTTITLTASGGSNDMVHVSGDTVGMYDLELTAAQLNFLGRMTLVFSDPDVHCPVFHSFLVVPANVYDSFVLGTDTLQVDATTNVDTANVTAIKAKTDQLNFAGTDVKATLDSELVTLAAVTHTGAVIPTVTALTNQVTADVTSLEGQALSSKVGDNFNVFFQNAGGDTTKVVDDVAGGGSGIQDWSADERAQIRSALGVDGTKSDAVSGQMQTLDNVADAIKVQTDKLNFTGTGVQIVSNADITSILADTNELQGLISSSKLPAQVKGVDADVITASAIAADAIGASELATDAVTEITTAIWAKIVDGTVTFEKAMKILLNVMASFSMTKSGNTYTYKDQGGNTILTITTTTTGASGAIT